MKIGIITITGEMNYGNSFQNYAVIKTLNRLGATAQTVITEYSLPEYFRLKKRGDFKLKPFLKSYGRIVLKYKMIIPFFFRKLKFRIFNLKYLNLSKKKNFELSPIDCNDYDLYVFGSDQIWNFSLDRMRSGIDYYTGDFSPNVKKIAYSASIGINYIPDECSEKVRENLNRFSAISVRENSGREILDTLLEKSVCVTVDPTLMLDCGEWLKIAKKPHFFGKNKRFILTYFLGEYSDEIIRFAKKIAQKYNCEIVDLCSEWSLLSKRDRKGYYSFSPNEFLWLVSNCEIMLTDSFHGSVFSMIFEKPFRCFERNQEGIADMSSRTQTLFNAFNIENWCVGDVSEDINNVFYKDYSNVNQILNQKRQEAYDYLKGALS